MISVTYKKAIGIWSSICHQFVFWVSDAKRYTLHLISPSFHQKHLGRAPADFIQCSTPALGSTEPNGVTARCLPVCVALWRYAMEAYRKTFCLSGGATRALPHNLCCKRITFGDFMEPSILKPLENLTVAFTLARQSEDQKQSSLSCLLRNPKQSSLMPGSCRGSGSGRKYKTSLGGWCTVGCVQSFCACALQSVQGRLQTLLSRLMRWPGLRAEAAGFQTGSL